MDTNPPVVGRVVELQPGAGTLDSAGLISRGHDGCRWSFNDPTSHVASHHLSLHSHIYGEFQSSPVQVGNLFCVGVGVGVYVCVCVGVCVCMYACVCVYVCV